MSARTAKWIFYLGTLVSLVIFLGLTVDTHHQIQTLTHTDQLNEPVVAGKRVWQKYNCNDCHTILGFGGYYAPDMTKAYWRRGEEGIKAMVRTPEKLTTWRKMPHFALSDQELNDLVAFLKWTSEIDTHDWPPQDAKLRRTAQAAVAMAVSPGAALFKDKGCFGCHKMDGTGGTLGPDLTRVGGQLNRETIAKILENPKSVNPQAVMPPPALSPDERNQIADFLAGKK